MIAPAGRATSKQHRWVVERTFAWLNQMKRLVIRYERRADIHDALFTLGCCMICFKFLDPACHSQLK